MKYKQYFEDFISSLEREESKQISFSKFKEVLEKKLNKGHHEHGDGVFERTPEEILKELKMEAMDLTGWSMILWVILNDLEKNSPEKQESISKFKQKVLQHAKNGFELWDEFQKDMRV